jgi:phage tail-like protein
MSRAQRTDPLRNFKFQVEIIPTNTALAALSPNLNKLGFTTMSGLSVTNDMLAYREGGMNTHTHKMVGLSDFSAVSFVRGVFAEGAELWKWQQFIHSWEGGVPNGSKGTDAGQDYRCDITVTVFDHPTTNSNYTYSGGDGIAVSGTNAGNKRLMMKLFNCWPGVFSLGGLSAGDSGIMVQELTVHHEGFVLAFNATDAANYSLTW